MGTGEDMEQGELEVSEPSRESSKLRLELPWPPSANHYTGYRVAGTPPKQFVQAYPTKEAKAFNQNVERIVFRDKAAKHLAGPLKLSAWTYPPDRRKRDTSNLFKMLEDAMQKAGVFLDDYQIVEHHVWRTSHVVSGGMVVVEIEPTVLM